MYGNPRASLYGAGAVVRPLALLPQQAIVPAARSPQVCSAPALTVVKVPVCAALLPFALEPQQ